MPRRATPIVLNHDEKSQLLSLAQSRALPHGLVQRAQIVLACAEGEPGNAIAARLRLNKNTVAKWRKRYVEYGLEGLHDELRAGRPRSHDDERVAEVINTALQSNRPPGPTDATRRVCADRRLKEHRTTVVQPVRGAAPATTYVQVIHRPLLHRKGARYRRVIPEPARPRGGPVCR